jgi:hypothetical protein
VTRPASFVPASARHVSGKGSAGVDEVGPGQCGHCGGTLPTVVGRGRSRKYCDATCRSRARRARTPPAPAQCSVRAGLGRCAARSAGAWYDQCGTVAAHTCAEHREVAGDLLRAGMPRKRTLDRWLPANVRWSPPQQAAPPRMAYQLTVTLRGVHPLIWRRLHVRADITLTGLHDVLQVAMGWDGQHLWRFGPFTFGDVRGEYDPTTTLDTVLRTPGEEMGYLYDFGDLWIHHIELDKVITRPRATLPQCTTGKRACPPEDCGGPWGYDDTLKALRARKGWRYHHARELCGTKFDPERFNRDEVNTALATLSAQ